VYGVKITTVALVTIAIAFLSGCYDSDERYIRRTVRGDELLGEWVMTSQTVHDLGVVGYTGRIDSSEHWIAVQPNGRCRFHTFTSALSPYGSPNELVDRPCRWAVRESNGRQSLLIEFIGEPATITRYLIMEKNGLLTFWQPAGDPDARRYVEYVRGRASGATNQP
jgi:hypothetical protein